MKNKENDKKKEEQPPNIKMKFVKDEIKLTDSFSVAKSVEQGYEVLSGTFSPHQANIAQKYNLGEGIKTLVINWVEIHGNVHGNVTQAVGSQVEFKKQLTDAFNKAYNMVEKKDDISSEQKQEILKNLKTMEEEFQGEEADAGKIQRSWKWIRQNAKWLVPTLISVVGLGLKIVCGV